MKSKIILLIICLPLSLFSQNKNFPYIIGTSQWIDDPSVFVIGHDNDIVIAAIKTNDYFNTCDGVIYLLDTAGQLSKNVLLADSLDRLILENMEVTDAGYRFFGYTSNYLSPPFNAHLLIIDTDKQLNLLDITRVKFKEGANISHTFGIIDKDSNFVASGRYTTDSTGVTHYPYVIKADKNGVISDYYYGLYPGCNRGENGVIKEDFNKKGYYLFSQYGKILQLNEDLSLANDSLELPFNQQDVISARLMSKGRFLIVTHRFRQFFITCFDTTGQVFFHREYGNTNTNEYDVSEEIEISKNAVFIQGYVINELSNPYFPSGDNKIFIEKRDTSFNLLWNKEIGWDAYFKARSVKATDDGGCIILSSVYDKDTMNQQHDIVLFKLDANGNVTGTHRIENAAVSVLNVYPNPGKDHFYVEGFNGNVLQVYSPNGKRLFEQQLNTGRNKVEMVKYPSGVYVLRLVDKQGRPHATAKWIKQ